jgi:YbbR domain-containing protein
VVLDMGGVGPGEHTFPIGLKNVNVPRGIRIVRATPSEVRLDLSRSFTRAVQVNVRFAGEGRNGYHVTALTVDPPELEIVGPHQRVAGIASVNTDPINVSSATGYMKVLVNAYVQDPFVRFESSPQVTVTFTMRK